MNEIGGVLLTGFGLVMLWLLVYFGLRPYRIDRVRMDLFKVRNALFLYAAEGGISFDDPAYRIMRNRINAIIRHAHLITVTRAIIFMVAEWYSPNLYAQALNRKWVDAKEKLSEGAQAKIKEINDRLMVVLARQLITGSPFILLLVAIWIAALKTVRYLRRGPFESMGLRVAKEFRVELIEEQAMLAQTQEQLLDSRELAHV